MRRFHISWFGVTMRSFFLTIALFLALILWYLPSFLNLDAFRPQVLDLLEQTFHCKAEMGHVHASLFPYPGLYVGQVVLSESSQNARVLASVGAVHVWVSGKMLLRGRLQFWRVRFYKPRFIFHRDQAPDGQSQWSVLPLPRAEPENQSSETGIERWDVVKGRVEMWDHTTTPVSKWVIDRLNGYYQARIQSGVMTGNALCLGPHSSLDLTYQGMSTYPLQVRLREVKLTSLLDMIHHHAPVLEGTAGVSLKVRMKPDFELHAIIDSLLLNRVPGTRIQGSVMYHDDHLLARAETRSADPMSLMMDGHFLKQTWDLHTEIRRYDSQLVQKFFDHPWLNRLTGGGSITASIQSGHAGLWHGLVTGEGFTLKDSPFQLPMWRAQIDPGNFSLLVQGMTAEKGAAIVSWTHRTADSGSALRVDVSSVTLREVLTVFRLQSRPGIDQTKKSWNPWGYETWPVDQGFLKAVIHPGTSLEVQESHLDLAGMSLDLKGTFDLQTSSPLAHIQGTLQDIPLAFVVESFFNPPSPITGTADTTFALVFPLSTHWIQGLNGSLDLQAAEGVVHAFKTFYRIMSVLNLTTYLRLRVPQLTAQGIVYQSLEGHLAFQQGVLSSDDLFLKSPAMNLGFQGKVDIPAQRLDTQVRIELFRFLEDVLKAVPITHWIFKKPNKIFLPLVVAVEGPWNNLDIH